MTGEIDEQLWPSSLLLDHVRTAIIATDLNDRVVYWNKYAETLYQWTAEEAIGKNLTDLLVLTSDHKLPKNNMKGIESREYWDEEWTAQRRDGTSFPVRSFVDVVKDGNGNAIGFVAVSRGITERNRAEDKLLALHAHARQLACARTLDEIIEHTLDAMEFTLGFSSAEFWLVDATRGRILCQEARGMTSSISEFMLDGPGITVKAVNTGRTIRVGDSRKEEAYVDDEGRVGKEKSPVKLSELAVPVLIDNKPVALLDAESISLDYFTDDDQRLLETLSSHVASALTSLRYEDELRRHSERLEELVKERSGRLAESEARYRRLFESSPISLWEEDFSEVKRYFDELRTRGVKDLRRHFNEHPEELAKCGDMVKLLSVNEATLRLYGAKTVDELRSGLSGVLVPSFQDRLREELVAVGEAERRFAGEFDNQTLTGDTKHVSLILNVIPGYEDTLGKVLISIIDLTDRRRMEEALLKSQRMATIGELAAMIGHDLRNPLTGIATATYNVKTHLGKGIDRQTKEMLDIIDQDVRNSDKIVGDLLEYARVPHLELAETDMKSVTIDALAHAQLPRRIRVVDSTKSHPKIAVDVDKTRRVFLNLIKNAADAMPKGGTLRIASRKTGLSLEIIFKDTGEGMTKETMEKIWNPLFTTKSRGMGFGLPIVKRLVEAHGGSVNAESKFGKGSTFTVTLPLKPKLAANRKKSA